MLVNRCCMGNKPGWAFATKISRVVNSLCNIEISKETHCILCRTDNTLTACLYTKSYTDQERTWRNQKQNSPSVLEPCSCGFPKTGNHTKACSSLCLPVMQTVWDTAILLSAFLDISPKVSLWMMSQRMIILIDYHQAVISGIWALLQAGFLVWDHYIQTG